MGRGIEPIKHKGLWSQIRKYFTLFVLFICPKQVASIFVNVSILTIICDLRNTRLDSGCVDHDSLSRLLKIGVCDEILLLPTYTMYLFWNDHFLKTEFTIQGKQYTFQDLVQDSQLFHSHIRLIVNHFIENLPKPIKLKLRLNHIHERIVTKSALTGLVLHSTI